MTNEKLTQRKTLDLDAARQRLKGKTGKTYWRSLSELAETEEFEQLIEQEFPRQASLLGDLNRRDFLKVLGASLALAGLTSCVPAQTEQIMPYVVPPEQIVPGKSTYFASTLVRDGYGQGVLVETTMGRPIKVEGNPQHPASLGASDVFMQAAILDLYDPDRAKQVTNGGAASSWADFAAAAGQNPGRVRVLSGPVNSPALTAQIQSVVDDPANWVQYSPVGRANTLAGAQMAFGGPFDPVYDFSAADVVLSLDSDFLFMEPGHIRYARDFKLRHQPISTQGTMSRLYMVESSATITGANADHRLGVRPTQVEAFARALAGQLGVNVPAAQGDVPGADWLEPLAADLQRAGANALVVVGERQPPVVHAIAHAINQALGALGSTVSLMPLDEGAADDPMEGLRGLVADLNAGAVDTLVILDGNPAYSMPADLEFAAAMQNARTSIYLGRYADETAALATWFIPAAHELEMWGDARAFDGTTSIIQPVIEPLYGGKSASEVLAVLQGEPDASGYDLLRGYYLAADLADDAQWRAALSQGIAPTGAGAPALESGGSVDTGAIGAVQAAQQGGADALEIVFEPDYSVWDGRYANNAWLQELPRPLTKLTWDNAACVSPNTAERLGVKQDDLVNIDVRGRTVQAPIYVQPGQPDGVVAVTLGYGRTAGGSVLAGTGFNAYAIRSSEAPWFDTQVSLTGGAGTYRLVTTQNHFMMENRELVREATLEEYQEHPDFAQHFKEELPSIYPEVEYPGYAWGMSINLNTCIGCNACVVACQSENNIPTVGKDQVARGREMHWLRVDAYFEGAPARPRRMVFQPVPCMHCEKAPCEPVCPVEATTHSDEGINEMTYNRCVGTRYCSNNCPYKVRRFNFFKYIDEEVVSLRAMRNPDVSIRSRGVMEKCTYCVQRVNEARIDAELEGRSIRDGEVRTACQQACPTQAIIFGDINDDSSAVRQLKDTPLNYALLDELGTQPRTTYLAKVRNTNPAIMEQA